MMAEPFVSAAVACIVAISDPSKAIDLNRERVAGPVGDVQDLGRVSAALLTAVELPPGESILADRQD
jgi:hypothetical protein